MELFWKLFETRSQMLVKFVLQILHNSERVECIYGFVSRT